MMKPTRAVDKPSGSPMAGRGPLRWVEEIVVKFHVCTYLGILLSGGCFPVDHEDYFRRNPTAAQALVFIKLCFRGELATFSGGTKHAHKIKALLIDPKLRRVKVACPGAHYVHRPPGQA